MPNLQFLRFRETLVFWTLRYRRGVAMPNFQIHLFAKASFLNSSLTNRRRYVTFFPILLFRETLLVWTLSYRIGVTMPNFHICVFVPSFQIHLFMKASFLNSSLSNRRHYAQCSILRVREAFVFWTLRYRICVTMPNFQIHLFAKASFLNSLLSNTRQYVKFFNFTFSWNPCFLNSLLSNRRHYAHFFNFTFPRNPCFLKSSLSNRRHYAQFSKSSFRESKFSELFAIK
jgi:hypothetical protein